MPYNINEFRVTAYNAMLNKSQRGNSISDSQVPKESQFNLLANNAVLSCYEQDYNIWVASKGQNLTQFLQTYLKSKTLSLPVTGRLNFPSDFQHTAAMGIFYDNAGDTGVVSADPTTLADKNTVFFSQKYTPTALFPKYTEYASYYQIKPQDSGIVYLDYFKTPNFPTWGYTIVDDAAVYDSATSVNFEFDEYTAPRVIGEFIKIVGINLKDDQLIKFGETYAQENQ